MGSVKDAMQNFAMQQALKYIEGNPEENLPKLMALVDRLTPEGWYQGQRNAIRQVIAEKNNWYQLILRLYELDAGVRRAFFQNFLFNASLKGSAIQDEAKEREHCNIPWAILLDPTSACNLRCTGCWAAEYGNHMNLTYEEMDDIVRQGVELGTYVYLFTGGEPLVRKKDIIRLCEDHPDCVFSTFTNGTLIDEAFADEMLRVKNFVPAISIEGFEEATDSRRGDGTYQKIIRAMNILKEKKLPFGISCCYTSANAEVIGSEAYFDQMIEMGAKFAWFFTYMPVGKGAVTELMATAEQREMMYHKIRKKTLLEAYRSPLFMGYHDNQPWNENMLRPCPVLDNPGRLTEIVEKSQAKSTDYQNLESAKEFSDKCVETAEKWAPVADRLWAESHGGCASCGRCARAVNE